MIIAGQETCLLDILLSLKDEENNVGFTNAELQDHIMTFMSAGHEVKLSKSCRYLFIKMICIA